MHQPGDAHGGRAEFGPENEIVGRVQVVLFFNFRGSRTTGPSGSGFCKSGASGLQEDSRSLLT
ncbi:hypothetical protein [Actinacidiphila oryziradicis]|uniref:hypothetical protein n=1 Tax=Actinacidiphila oryziradicis TaxID=2571141 RepID=UPI0023F275A0|nr:hypothetical protein [Actinacidiphila oryziradicis]MCW2871466.1 hypothetical protein [Actinacidiphila oryziradicis]